MRDYPALHPSRIRFLALAMLAGTSAGAYLTRYCLSVSTTVIEGDLGLSHPEMSVVFASFMAGYTIGQIPGGRLGQRFGTRGTLALIIAIWSVCTTWSACCRSLTALAVSQFAVGLAQAGLVPLSSSAVKAWFPASRRGVPSAVIAAAMSAGGVAAMWFTGRLLAAWQENWRAVFHLYTLVGLGWALVFFLLFRTRPQQHPWVNAAEIAEIEGEETSADGSQPPPMGGWEIARRMAGSVSVWALGVHWFFRSAGYQYFARWFPAFLIGRYGMDVPTAGSYSSWPLLGWAVGSLAGGFVVDSLFRRTGSKRLSRNVVSIVTLTASAVCFVISEGLTSGEGFVALMALAGLLAGMSMPAGWTANIDIGGRETALMFAVMNMAATLAGIVAPTVVGLLMPQAGESPRGYTVIVLLHAVVYLTSALAWLFVDPNRAVDAPAGAPLR